MIREYDSLSRDESGTFGFGWRLANRDTFIETNVPATGRETQGAFNPFRFGTRLYLTLPETSSLVVGRRVAFTFTPEKHELPGLTFFTPAWTPDDGVNFTLRSANATLTLAGDRLYDLKTGKPYNPASGLFDVPELLYR